MWIASIYMCVCVCRFLKLAGWVYWYLADCIYIYMYVCGFLKLESLSKLIFDRFFLKKEKEKLVGSIYIYMCVCVCVCVFPFVYSTAFHSFHQVIEPPQSQQKCFCNILLTKWLLSWDLPLNIRSLITLSLSLSLSLSLINQ